MLKPNTKRSRLYLALSGQLSLKKYSAIFGLPMLLASPIALSAEVTEKWQCVAGDNGQWQCSTKTVAGKTYTRPKQANLPQRSENQDTFALRSSNLDWVDEKYLSAEEKAKLNPACCGTYIEPTRDYPDANLKPDEAPLRVTAATTEVETNNLAKLEGGVQLTQGYRQVKGDSATLHQETRIAEIAGNVQYREPGILLQGDKATVNLDTKQVSIDNLKYLFHEAGVRGSADLLERSAADSFSIDNATYTTCKPGSNTWQLHAGSLSINTSKNMATAKNVRIKVKDIPLFYLPWLTFPVGDKRTSGLLFPHFELSDESGFDYAQPIYWNIAPNYDATITPRYIQERGLAIEAEGRHISRITNTAIGGNILFDDDGGDDPDYPVKIYEGDDRWIAHIDHSGGFGKRWSTLIDYTEVSDVDYFRDIGVATLEANSQTHLTQKTKVGYQLDNWNFSVATLEFQNLRNGINRSDDYEAVPIIEANGNYRFGDFVASLSNQFASFDHDDNFDNINNPIVTGDRTHIDYNIAWDKRWIWGFFKPQIGTKYISYDLSNTGTGETSPSATIPMASFDAGLYFERQATWIGNYIQTFEPRLYGLYVDFEDQSEFPEFDTTERTFSYDQLFRDNRFAGGDRVGDAEQISIGLTSRLLRANDGKEVLQVSLGQAFYLKDRRVTLPSSTLPLISDESAYAGELAFSLGENWQFNSSLLYNEDGGVIDKGHLYLGYQDEDNKLFNLAYRYTRKLPRFDIESNQFIKAHIEQADLSAYLPISDNWNIVARWNYDFTNSRELEIFAGLEYNSCCWRISLLTRQWLDQDDNLLTPEEELEDDSGLFLQVQFKGLGGTGKKIDSILSDGITGYQINE